MSKELTYLSLLLSNDVYLSENEREEYIFSIESALRRLEELERENELFKYQINECAKRDEKQDEILRIIKEKGIDTEMFSQLTTYDEYCELYKNDEIFRNLFGNYTQEEFELLKEVLL